jgi:hypothetical protein
VTQQSQQPPPARTRRASTGLWVLIIVILLPPTVLPLWVPLYDREDPKLWGFPFFYWFQTSLILLAVVCMALAYRLSLVADRRDREERDR